MSAQVREVSSLFKIARWVVLGAGVSYGFVHGRSLHSIAVEKRVDQAYARKVALIEEAKKKFAEQKAAQSGGSGEKFDFSDPSFDFDRWAKHAEAKFQ
ncbi:F1F0 ATP synthase subunit e, mitochondrial [Coemansia sp. RSA 552]|nr:F1F0 ATP synthase subunit e, mitochondrial [Coemansia sp. RSA 552]